MWGYFENGKCIATNPNNMSGNTGWKEVPDDIVPTEQSEPTEKTVTLEERTAALESAFLELVTGGAL